MEQPTIPTEAELVARLKVALRALVRERIVYFEDVETLRQVVELLESNPPRPPRTFWIAWQNTDLTEGRGSLVPLAICELEATARRVGKGKDVQGCDCRVSPFECPCVGGRYLAPFQTTPATKEDRLEGERLQRHRAAMDKAKAAGLTDAEIKALGGTP